MKYDMTKMKTVISNPINYHTVKCNSVQAKSPKLAVSFVLVPGQPPRSPSFIKNILDRHQKKIFLIIFL